MTRIWLTGLLLLTTPAAADTIALRGTVHTGQGQVLEDGWVVVRDGKLVSVGRQAPDLPADARRVDVPGAELTPGLIDAAAHAVSTREWVYGEQTSEVIPHLRVLDALELDSHEWLNLARKGITTVYVTADPTSVIGPQGALVKTGGPGERVLQEAGASKANLGQETWSRGAWNRRPRGDVPFTTRRPTTRMGLVWVFREAFDQARRDELTGPAGEALRAILAGEASLRVQARHVKDLQTCLRLARELGIEKIVLEEATEVYRVLEEVRAAGYPVIFGPLFETPLGFRARTDEARRPCLETPALLAEAGIPFALTAADRVASQGDSLPQQAMLAIRYGLEPQAALAAVTRTPAELLGVAARIGTLEAGKDADLVVWNGPPFAATSRPLLVLIDGAPVLDEVPAPSASHEKSRY